MQFEKTHKVCKLSMFSTSQGMRNNYVQNIPLQGTLTNSTAQIEALQLEMFKCHAFNTVQFCLCICLFYHYFTHFLLFYEASKRSISHSDRIRLFINTKLNRSVGKF